jgi:DNA-binding phage protein
MARAFTPELARDPFFRPRTYKALSPNGNPRFETVTKIVGAFGMRLSAHAA